MLIAKPEHNKTSILKMFDKCKNLMYTVDLSPKPLIEFLKLAAEKKYYHLIVPDFIKVVSHNYITSSSTVVTLNAMIEEGIQRSMYYGQQIDLKENVRCGLITSITPEFFKQQFKMWNDIGFLSRFLPVSYEYSPETRMAIHRLIAGGNGGVPLDKRIGKIRKQGQKDIGINNTDVSAAINLYCNYLTEKLNTFEAVIWHGSIRHKIKMNVVGYRLHKQLRLLAQSIALDRGLKEVNYECLEELKTLIDYMGHPNTPKFI